MARCRVPRLAGGALHHSGLAGGSLHRRHRPRVHPRQLPDPLGTRTSTDASPCDGRLAAAVTVTDAVLALPIAYYMARVASPRTRGILVAILTPLWASYLVKVRRIVLSGQGRWTGRSSRSASRGPAARPPARGSCSATSAPVHDPADLRGARAHPQLAAEASSDLGSRGLGTFRRHFSRSPSRRSSPARSSRSPDPRRLHQPPPWWKHELHRERRLHERRRGEFQPAVRRRFRHDPGPIMVVYLALARRTGAFENLYFRRRPARLAGCDHSVHLPPPYHPGFTRSTRTSRGTGRSRLHDGLVRRGLAGRDVRSALWLSVKSQSRRRRSHSCSSCSRVARRGPAAIRPR